MIIPSATPIYQAAPVISAPAPGTTYYTPAAPATYPSTIPGIVPSTVPGVVPSTVPYSVPLETLPKPKVPGAASADMNVARVMIKAPLDLVIRVNGQVIRRDEAEMAFRTPTLKGNAPYTYDVEAEKMMDGKLVKDLKTVVVKPGEETVVDFNGGKQFERREALVTVNLPENARLFVDGAPYKLPTGHKTFATPGLVPGNSYHYEMKAEVEMAGKTITESQVVKVSAGKSVTVEFNKLNSQLTAAVSR